MATTAQPVQAPTRTHANPIVLWHLLSLDAPSVAALWTWFLAAANHIRLPAAAIVAMAVAVWTFYVADRLLDARLLDARLLDARPFPPPDLEPRHLFHHRHRHPFRTGLFAASVTLVLLLPRLATSSIHLYLILGALLAGYFALIHIPTPRTSRLPKELAVGVFFSAATFIPTVARVPALRPGLLPAALLFALCCSLNCLYIYAWEHAHPHPSTTHAATLLALRYLKPLTLAVALTGLALSAATHLAPWPIPTATALAAILLFLLDRNRATLSPTALRTAADLCLLTPLLFLPFLG